MQGSPARTHLISRTYAYHGTHGFGTSLAMEPLRQSYGPLVESVSHVAYDDPQALEDEIMRVGPERVAAFFCEPVIGAGGVRPAPAGYLDAVGAICKRHGVLLVIDSVICGFGRLGTWLGYERFAIEPDMVVLAKGITSGYLPLGGVLVSAEVSAPFWSEPGRAVFRHGATYAGHPTCCAAALANLDILERERLIPRGRELEGDLMAALAPLAGHPARRRDPRRARARGGRRPGRRAARDERGCHGPLHGGDPGGGRAAAGAEHRRRDRAAAHDRARAAARDRRGGAGRDSTLSRAEWTARYG